MKHYTYRITNIKLNKHYYGTRTSKNKTPEEDIGVYYFSSSSDKKFIKDQKDNPLNYKYKIIKKFNTREEAIKLEIKLHNKFNVGINESFYNRSKQTSSTWDTTGLSFKHSDETKLKIGTFHKNKIVSKYTRKKMSESAKLKKFSNKHRENKSKSMKSNKNSMAKQIIIYNELDEEVYYCNGNFKKICNDNNLPFTALAITYREVSKLYQTKKSLTYAKMNKNIKYIGWYARII